MYLNKVHRIKAVLSENNAMLTLEVDTEASWERARLTGYVILVLREYLTENDSDVMRSNL